MSGSIYLSVSALPWVYWRNRTGCAPLNWRPSWKLCLKTLGPGWGGLLISVCYRPAGARKACAISWRRRYFVGLVYKG